MVASLTVGARYGIAKKARPILVKIVGDWTTAQSRGSAQSVEGWEWIFTQIEQVVWDQGLIGTAVIVMSATPSLAEHSDEHEQQMIGLFGRHLEILKDLGVVWVNSAGNRGYDASHPDQEIQYLGEAVPQMFGREGSGIITVGSVNSVGRYSSWNTPPGPPDYEYPGHITVYAQGENVKGKGNGGHEAVAEGTSFAAPQVAGLVAYFLAAEPDYFAWDHNGINQGNSWNERVHQSVVGWSYRRLPWSLQLTPGVDLPYNFPGDINVAYNGAWGEQYACDDPAGPSRRDDGTPGDADGDGDDSYQCPLPQPSTMKTSVAPAPTATAEPTTTAKPSTTEQPTTTKAAPPPPTPTNFYKPENGDGCANDDCSQCAPGFTQSCRDNNQDRVTTCYCQYDSGCAQWTPNRGRYFAP
ncbi:peptidase S8/S53 domain-containing protein [Xylariaceae sp. FL0016]|nr:peptidase S8/S53 domain-containing protein [Xylariaceae sp. FL0016]